MDAAETNAREMNDLDISYDLAITEVTRRNSGGGAWVCGTILGHRFQALVFPEHAENSEYEIGDSRISKLWLQRQADAETVYNWDRGLETPAADATVNVIVEFLCDGLAAYAYNGGE